MLPTLSFVRLHPTLQCWPSAYTAMYVYVLQVWCVQYIPKYVYIFKSKWEKWKCFVLCVGNMLTILYITWTLGIYIQSKHLLLYVYSYIWMHIICMYVNPYRAIKIHVYVHSMCTYRNMQINLVLLY